MHGSTVFTHILTSECCLNFSKMTDFDKREDGLVEIWTSLATAAISPDISIALGPAPITTTICKILHYKYLELLRPILAKRICF